jgi:hypothetical protein
MAISYRWEIVKLHVHPSMGGLTDVVARIDWCLVGEDADGYTARLCGHHTDLPTDGLDAATFTEFSALDNAWCAGQVERHINPRDLAKWRQIIADRIAAQHVETEPRDLPAEE